MTSKRPCPHCVSSGSARNSTPLPASSSSLLCVLRGAPAHPATSTICCTPVTVWTLIYLAPRHAPIWAPQSIVRITPGGALPVRPGVRVAARFLPIVGA